MTPEFFMQRAIELSARALGEPGTEPFGAVVVRDGRIVGEGFNHSLVNLDPTSHGETEAIRDACRRLGTLSLAGCELYSSCEPCALCVAAMHIAGITRLVYAVTLEQSDAALAAVPQAARPQVDVAVLRAEAGAGLQGRRMPSVQQMPDAALAVLKAWAAQRTS